MKDFQPMKTSEILRRLDIMAESGGMITKDRKRAIMEASARIRELEEALSILRNTGGDGHEEH